MTPLLLSIASPCVSPISRPGWQPIGSDWTRPKLRSCGWVLVNSSPSLTSPMCAFCRRVSDSKTQTMTSASSLTASWHRWVTLLRSVEANATSCGNCNRTLWPAVCSLSEDASKKLEQAFVSCRLDYCSSLFFGISDRLMSRRRWIPWITGVFSALWMCHMFKISLKVGCSIIYLSAQLKNRLLYSKLCYF